MQVAAHPVVPLLLPLLAVCRKVKLGKVFCSTKPLVGCPYGSMFTLAADGKSLERTE
jgi:hypothetical protein